MVCALPQTTWFPMSRLYVSRCLVLRRTCIYKVHIMGCILFCPRLYELCDLHILVLPVC